MEFERPVCPEEWAHAVEPLLGQQTTTTGWWGRIPSDPYRVRLKWYRRLWRTLVNK